MSQFIFACILSCQTECAVEAPQPHDLAARMEKATTFAETVELLASVDPDDVRTQTAIRNAQTHKDVGVRVFAAMALLKFRNDPNYRVLWRVAIADPSESVRAIAHVDGLLHGEVMDHDEEMRLLEDENPLLRAAVAATRTDPRDLYRCLSDDSGFVRAVTARRYSKMDVTGGTSNVKARRGIEVLLTDPDAFVRGNAIVAARQLKHMPLSTMRGLMFDSRPFTYITEVFLLDEPDSAALRKYYHIADTLPYKWILILLAAKSFELFQPDPVFARLLLPVTQRVLIGAVAADSLVEVGVENVSDELDWALGATGKSPLAEQLRIVRTSLEEKAYRRRCDDAS